MDEIPADSMKVIRLLETKQPEEIPALLSDYIRTRGGNHGDAMVVKIAAPIIAEGKTTARLIASIDALRNTGRGLTLVGIWLAAIQALTGIAAIWLAVR